MENSFELPPHTVVGFTPAAGCREYVIRERDSEAKQLGGQYRVFKARSECNTPIARIRI